MPDLSPIAHQQAMHALERLVTDVHLVLYLGTGHSIAQEQPLQQLAAQLAAMSPLLHLLQAPQPDTGLQARTPTLALWNAEQQDTGIRFLGSPAGLEFEVLLSDLIAISRGSTELTPLARAYAQQLPAGELQVLVTPSCPRCAQAARLAHQIALASKKVHATVTDLTLFPDLAQRYQATTAPYFVWNETLRFPGPVPELALLQRLADA